MGPDSRIVKGMGVAEAAGIEVIRVATPGGASGDVIERAVSALAAGTLIVLPTETVYGVFASEADPGRDRLEGLVGRDGAAGAAWHTASVGAAIDRLGITEAGHLWLMSRVLPGPVTVVRASNGLAVRVIDDPTTARVLTLCEERGVRVIASALAGPTSAGDMGAGADVGPITQDQARLAALGRAGVSLVVDAGPTRLGRVSTLVRLDAGGGHTVVRESAIPARLVEKRLVRSVLFVCTGNTCRSPMAAALARSVLADESWGERVSVASAGVHASRGGAMTIEAERALRSVGVEPGPHSSRPLTRAMVSEADEIYGLTTAHIAAIEEAFPEARGRVRLLDPDGSDVPDPIGGPQSVYDSTCRALLGLVRRRLVSGAPGPLAGRP